MSAASSKRPTAAARHWADSDGNVAGYRDEITPARRHKLKASAAAAMKDLARGADEIG